jgi:hypothetical protein|tara:strand:+ start:1231 stop:1950 length:720 start_codon:yes stop_codon:yes gene_type:complete
MAEVLGVNIPTPSVDISGFLSTSWIYILVIGFIGFILISILAVVLFFFTYNRRIELYENIAGRGYGRTKTAYARIIKLGRAGQEVLRTFGGAIFSAYGRKVGRNTYAYARGQDGYWYNFIHGDLDAKMSILDIEPVDRDVRMFHLGVDKVAQEDYSQKKGFIEKYGMHMIMAVLVIGILVGFYVIAGKINEGLMASNNPETARITQNTAELLDRVLTKIDSVQRGGTSGLVPVEEGGGG